MANPLTPQQIDDLRKALTQVKELIDDIAKAERAGLDVVEQKANALSQKKQIEQLLAVYG